MAKIICILFVIPILWFMACDSGPTEGEPQVYTLVIGFTASETGNYQLLSSRQTNGLKLWTIAISLAAFAQGSWQPHSLGRSGGRLNNSVSVYFGLGGRPSPSRTICML